MKKEEYETCVHVKSIGINAVYVGAGCLQAKMVKGKRMCWKKHCRECGSWKKKE